MGRLLFILALSAFLLDRAQAEDPVFFADARLKAAVEADLWTTTDPTPTDMLSLTMFYAGDRKIESIVGIEYAKNLWYLSLRLNNIEDISPLSGLTNLTQLILHKNPLGSLSPLSSLTNLTSLDLDCTFTSDISALAHLTNLTELFLYDNKISDISVLTGLTSLRQLDLRLNSLNQEAFDVHIPQIKANNPGIDIKHDLGPHLGVYSVTISSTRGGSVISPGEGTITVTDNSTRYVRLEAQADPGFIFSAWTGTCFSAQNPMLILLDQDHEICAVFTSLMTEFHVDDNAPGDPDPSSSDTGDPQEDGTTDHPFDSIQEAIDVAGDGAAIFVRPGTYRENITISGKSIDLIGREPNDPNGTELPVIRADHEDTVVLIDGNNDTHCTLSGFAITAGTGQADVIRCSGGGATVSHCLIAGNQPAGFDSTLISCNDSEVALRNCTIADNYIGTCSGGIRAVGGNVTLTNSIFYHNTYNCSNAASSVFYTDEAGEIAVTYSDIEGGWPGTGNLDTDPLFAHRGQWMNPRNPLSPCDPSTAGATWSTGDYHLLSDAGRWDMVALNWICDEAASPCIDAGDPAGKVKCELAPNGGIINMGVYGGTTEASRSH